MNLIALTYVLGTFVISVVKPNSIELLPKIVNAVENSSVTLTCSKKNGFLSETRWMNSQTTEDANLAFYNGQCIVTRFLLDSNLFDGICNENGTYSVLLKTIDRKQHGSEWTCMETSISISNIVSIYVSVPAVDVEIRSHENIDMRENQTQSVRCQTSACRPSPAVKWFLRSFKHNVTYEVTENSTQSYISQEYGLMATESILVFFPNKTVNNWHLFCEVWTQREKSDISSKEFVVNVLFPPSEVSFTISRRGSEGGTNNGEVVTFACSTESNPKSVMFIKDQRNKQLNIFKNASFVNLTIHKVSCDDAGEYTCYARNIFTVGQEAKSKLILVVRCPPRPKTVKDDNVTALLRSDVTLQFTAHDFFDEQNKTVFTWYKQSTSLQNGGSKHIISSYGLQSVLVIRNITQTDYGQYRVIVRNSFGQYIHYYELKIKDNQEPEDSTITGTIIGVAVGTFAFTILVVVLSLIGYKYLRRNHSLERSVTQPTRNENDTVSENQTTSTYDDINLASDPKTVYEQLDDKGREGQAYMEMQNIKNRKKPDVTI